MAISIRGNAGAWVASNATTQTVTLPTHVAGDMLIVRAAQKPYSAAPTCATSGWAGAGTAYQNGTTANGNGLGSLKLIAFWKVAASASEPNPVVTWNTTSAPGACCPVVYQKGVDDSWVTPVGAGGGDATPRTAHTATISSHISTTAGDLVDFFTAWCDNYAATVPTFTQAGLTLGTVAEQPATALSSALSNDMAADGGYRLVTAGTSSAAAVVTGTFGNSEQAGSWTTRLRVEAAAPQLVTPGAASLTTTTFAPTVSLSDNKTVTPGVASLTLTPLAPTVAATAHQTVTPGTVALTLTPQTPTVTASDHQTVTPGTASLTLTPQTPTVGVSDNQTVTPGSASLSLTPQAPAVAVSNNIAVTPGTASLALTAFAPSTILSDHQLVTPGVAALTLTPYAPTVTGGAGVTVTPGTAALSLTAFAPTTVLSDHQLVTPGVASLALTAFAPTVTGGAGFTVTPGAASLALTAFAPTVTLGGNQTVTPGTAALALTAFAPDMVLSDHKFVTPGTASLVLTAYAPTVSLLVPLPEFVLGAITQPFPVLGAITHPHTVNGAIEMVVAIRAEIIKL